MTKASDLFCRDSAATVTSPAAFTVVLSPIDAAVSLRATLIPTPTPMPALALGSSAAPLPRELKSVVVSAVMLSLPPVLILRLDDASAPPIIAASTSSSMTDTPTAAATSTFLPPWVPFCLSAVSFNALELVFLGLLGAVSPSSSPLAPFELAVATAS